MYNYPPNNGNPGDGNNAGYNPEGLQQYAMNVKNNNAPQFVEYSLQPGFTFAPKHPLQSDEKAETATVPQEQVSYVGTHEQTAYVPHAQVITEKTVSKTDDFKNQHFINGLIVFLVGWFCCACFPCIFLIGLTWRMSPNKNARIMSIINVVSCVLAIIFVVIPLSIAFIAWGAGAAVKHANDIQ